MEYLSSSSNVYEDLFWLKAWEYKDGKKGSFRDPGKHSGWTMAYTLGIWVIALYSFLTSAPCCLALDIKQSQLSLILDLLSLLELWCNASV